MSADFCFPLPRLLALPTEAWRGAEIRRHLAKNAYVNLPGPSMRFQKIGLKSASQNNTELNCQPCLEIETCGRGCRFLCYGINISRNFLQYSTQEENLEVPSQPPLFLLLHLRLRLREPRPP